MWDPLMLCGHLRRLLPSRSYQENFHGAHETQSELIQELKVAMQSVYVVQRIVSFHVAALGPPSIVIVNYFYDRRRGSLLSVDTNPFKGNKVPESLYANRVRVFETRKYLKVPYT